MCLFFKHRLHSSYYMSKIFFRRSFDKKLFIRRIKIENSHRKTRRSEILNIFIVQNGIDKTFVISFSVARLINELESSSSFIEELVKKKSFKASHVCYNERVSLNPLTVTIDYWKLFKLSSGQFFMCETLYGRRSFYLFFDEMALKVKKCRKLIIINTLTNKFLNYI